MSLDKLIPAQHLVRVIDAFVDRLELAELGFEKAAPAATGRPAYHPADLLKLYLYGYLNRVRSSRRLERECQRNVEVMWLLGRLAPDHKTIADFRRLNGRGLRAACALFVRFCRAAGLLGGEWVAIDGSKFRAVASNDSAVTRKQLRAEQARLEERVAQYLADLDRCDREDGETHLREEQLKGALEALQRHAGALDVMEQQGLTQQVHSEPEAKLMHTRGGIQVAYNVQTAVDSKHALVIAHEVTSEATDNRSLQPMAQAAKEVLGVESLKVTADAGYSNGEQAAACEAAGIDPFVPPNRSDTPGGGTLFSKVEFKYDAKSDTYRCPANQLLERKQLMRKERAMIYTTDACDRCKLRKRCTTGRQRYIMRHLFEDALQRLKKRVEEHPEAMRIRRSTVEHPFGTLKYQIFGHPRFLLRGRWGAGSEMALGILAYNLKRALAVLGTEGFYQKLAASPS